MRAKLGLWAGQLLIGVLLLGSGVTNAERISDIRNTKHNFSATVLPDLPDGGVRDTYAASESQICAFCHTPHGATLAPQAPLWNRTLSTATYTPYNSSSLDAVDLGQPEGKSKLCLSCHDGTLALGQVNVLNRVEHPTVEFTGPGKGRDGGKVPIGPLGSDQTGFTRRLGTDLTNDHPISFTYDSAQAERDGELYDPAAVAHLGERVRGEPAPALPLENGQVECVSCHDPHIRDTSGENVKFLRANRFQSEIPPVDKQFSVENDIICLGCHDKAGWVGSAHANPDVATYTYTNAAADLREFPRDMPVWRAACLNCHDPHTVQGSRRLLREGVDGGEGVTAAGAKYKTGGTPAIEQTCYACHSADGNVLNGQNMRPGFGVPDVKTDFTTPGNTHMPISTLDQAADYEKHSIGSDGLHQGGKDFVESPANMGKASKVNKLGEAGSMQNRHAECTDCHNPHRVSKNRLFWEDNNVPDEEGTHPHHPDELAAHNPQGYHTNIASGVLRGIFGVEPLAWESSEFGANPTVFDIKRGDPGNNASDDINSPYVTREYQVCMKCHSNYSYDTPPPLGSSSGTTPSGIEGVTASPDGSQLMTHYTNQGMEFQSPNDHKGEGTSPTPSGAFRGVPPNAGGYSVDFQANNHRSWHPVMNNTGRTEDVRGIASPNIWRSPFNLGVGVQTMYCTDCHGNNTEPGTSAPTGGVDGNVWGPHGSENVFLLKGPWSDKTGSTDPANGDGSREGDLCFKCHDYSQYGEVTAAGGGNAPNALDSGFKRLPIGSPGSCIGSIVEKNAHVAHGWYLGTQPGHQPMRCTYCHIAVPHGWKNKVFLANLNDVGPEGGQPHGTQVRNKVENRYYKYPYYNGAVLKVKSFARSGEWLDTNCGSVGFPGNGIVGSNWMRGSGGNSEACINPP